MQNDILFSSLQSSGKVAEQFVSNNSGTENASGYCIDVFNTAIKLLPYPVPCSFILIGDGLMNPNYDELVNMVAQNVSISSIMNLIFPLSLF